MDKDKIDRVIDAFRSAMYSEFSVNEEGMVANPPGGFLDDMEGEGHEYLPVIWASASPSGKVTKDAFERIVGKITDALKQETPDAIEKNCFRIKSFPFV